MQLIYVWLFSFGVNIAKKQYQGMLATSQKISRRKLIQYPNTSDLFEPT